MKKLFVIPALGLAAATGAMADEYARVISATPVVQQVAVPRQVCNVQQVQVAPQPSGAGAIAGAIAGGILGNTIGHGSGRAAATMFGMFGGAAIGSHLENHTAQAQNVQQCTTQTTYENRTVAYNVVYEYAGKQHSVQMPNDPGPTLRLQITPIGSNQAHEVVAGTIHEGDVTYMPQPTYVSPVVVPQPMVVYPTYYQRPYYAAPIGISFGIGYSGHRHHHRHHRHHRHHH